jgi:hypothetical protein
VPTSDEDDVKIKNKYHAGISRTLPVYLSIGIIMESFGRVIDPDLMAWWIAIRNPDPWDKKKIINCFCEIFLILIKKLEIVPTNYGTFQFKLNKIKQICLQEFYFSLKRIRIWIRLKSWFWIRIEVNLELQPCILEPPRCPP